METSGHWRLQEVTGQSSLMNGESSCRSPRSSPFPPPPCPCAATVPSQRCAHTPSRQQRPRSSSVRATQCWNMETARMFVSVIGPRCFQGGSHSWNVCLSLTVAHLGDDVFPGGDCSVKSYCWEVAVCVGCISLSCDYIWHEQQFGVKRERPDVGLWLGTDNWLCWSWCIQPRMSIRFESLLFLSSCPRTVTALELGNGSSRVLLLHVLGMRLLLIDFCL